MSAHGITPAPHEASIEMPGDVWEALLATGEPRDYRAGAWIFVEDDPPGPAFAVIEGMVRVEAARERSPLGLGTFGPGSLFGELAAIDGHPRSASAIATEATQVVAIEAATFSRLLAGHPDFALAMLRLLAARLRSTTTFAVEHMPQALDRRLAATLCELARTRGTPEGSIVMVDVTQGELATLLRADPEVTGGAIKRLRARGLVVPGRHSLHVINVPLLEALARSAV
jgi:CRP/FNR family transcriptional regulator, cyclic AMP receptor protein